MKHVYQTLPVDQKHVVLRALEAQHKALTVINDRVDNETLRNEIFDIFQLMALIRGNSVTIGLEVEAFENFSSDNEVDFPIYHKMPPVLEETSHVTTVKYTNIQIK